MGKFFPFRALRLDDRKDGSQGNLVMADLQKQLSNDSLPYNEATIARALRRLPMFPGVGCSYVRTMKAPIGSKSFTFLSRYPNSDRPSFIYPRRMEGIQHGGESTTIQ